MEEIIEKIYKEAHYCSYHHGCTECDRYVDGKCTWAYPPYEIFKCSSISKSMIEWVIAAYEKFKV